MRQIWQLLPTKHSLDQTQTPMNSNSRSLLQRVPMVLVVVEDEAGDPAQYSLSSLCRVLNLKAMWYVLWALSYPLSQMIRAVEQ